MFVTPDNPIIKQSMTNFLSKDLKFSEHVWDYDNCSYLIHGVEDQKMVRFSIKTNCADQLFANGA